MPWSYVTVERLQAQLNTEASARLTGADDKADWLLKLAVGVSQATDRYCGRTFRVMDATTRLFTPEFVDYMLIPDLLSVDELATDWNYDGIYETIWSTRDYYLEPTDASLDLRPYTRVRVRPSILTQFNAFFPASWPESLRLTGKWGFWEDLVDSGVTLSANCTISDTVLTVSDASALQRGKTYKLGNEQVFAYRKDTNNNTITVDRAQNNSVAAAHSSGVALLQYEYPEALEVACVMQATRAYRRIAAPLGVVNTPGDIGWRAVYIPKFDADVRHFLAEYRKQAVV